MVFGGASGGVGPLKCLFSASVSDDIIDEAFLYRV